ncbi:MAG TPA: murein biosynthesis integral membrane protein MurJ [Acidimicrobiales bacterium]
MTATAPSLGRATLVQAAGTALSRITGFGRIFAMAYALGKTPLAGTYVLANNTPNIIFELALGGVLSGMVLPEFVRQLRGGRADGGKGDDASDDDGWRAVSAVVTVSLVACAALAVAFVVVAPWFIRLYTLRNPGELGDEQLSVATDLLRLFAPQVFFYGTVYLSTAILRAQRRFAAPMFAPVLNNVVVIAMFLAWPSVVGTRSLEAVREDAGALLLLGLGTTAGVTAMALAQLPIRTLKQHVRWVWEPRHPSVLRIVRLGGWTAAFVATNQLALFVVYFLANGAPADVAAYFYAYTIFLLPHGVVAVSVISALQPELSERWAADDPDGFRRQLGTGLRTIWAILLPAAAGYVLLARPLVAALLEHGALGEAGAGDIAGTLALFALGLPAFSSWMFLTSAYQAMQTTRSLFFLYLIENGVNVVAAIALYPVLGVEGLALAFALAYAAGSAAALVDLRRRLGRIGGGELARSAARVAAATAVMALAVAAVIAVVGDDHGSGALLRSGAGTLAGVSVYFAAARVLRVGEIRDLFVRRPRGQ